MTRAAAWIVGLLALSAAGCAQVGGATAGPETACDRACLTDMMTSYLDALVAHDPGRLPLAADVRFTEDTVERPLGEGLWATASGLRSYRQDVIDVRGGVAGAHVVAEENGAPVLLAARLKVVDRKITEIETMVVRGPEEGLIFNVDALTAASPAMTMTPPASQRETRAEAIRIASAYPAGLAAGSFVAVDAQFAPDAYRFENGAVMAGPACERNPACKDIKSQTIPKLADATYRVAAVDEEKGIVWMRLDFGRSPARDDGRALTVWEAFKVYGGQIHAVEAFMEVMPVGSGSGWD